MLSAMVLLALLGQEPAQIETTKYVLDVAEVKRVRATLTYKIHCDKLQAEEWIFYAAHAPELTGQAKVSTKLEPKGRMVPELSAYKRPVQLGQLEVTMPQFAKDLPIRVVHEATLRSRKLRALAPGEMPPRVAPLSERERKLALLGTGDFDFAAAASKKWRAAHKLERGPAESDIDFARRVFLVVKLTFKYEYRADMDLHASAVCRAGRSDCGGLSTLFVATLRANGIPARALYGRWAMSAMPGDKIGQTAYYQWHVKSEFHAAGVGWVPADMSSAILHDKTKAGLVYFGADAGDFFVQHIDSNLALDSIHFGRETIHNLQQPVFWVTGSGEVDPRKITEDWQVRTLP